MNNFIWNVKHTADNDTRISGAYNILITESGKAAFITTPFSGDFKYNRLVGSLEPVGKAPANLKLHSHQTKA